MINMTVRKAISGSVSYADLVGAGFVKYFGEKALTPVIGNGTYMSGAVKLAGGFAARKFMGRGMLGDSVSLGLSIDGVEDILTNLLGGTSFGLGSGGETDW
jgi:hypothetical protein